MDTLSSMSLQALEETLITANDAYRNTDTPVMADEAYDRYIGELKQRDPNHTLLNRVEPEADFGEGKVRHSRPMLSTDKVKNEAGIAKWIKRIESAAIKVGVETPVKITINAKLDGMAGRLENGILASRGDGATGNDISRMMALGLVILGNGDGEIIIHQGYFEESLATTFKNPRNAVAGLVSADTMRIEAKQALQDGAVRFVSYSTLPAVNVMTNRLVERLPEIRHEIISNCEYLTDGLILTVEDKKIREAMGSTGHHHNWMVAAKTAGESAVAKATGVHWSIGRTGVLTPVVTIEPTQLSGVTISNVTAHHAGNIINSGIGTGALLRISRGGEVIPKIEEILTRVEPVTPETCPCCGTITKMERDFLTCTNKQCKDRLRARLNHFFHTIGTIDLFGPVACEKLVEAGITNITEVFSLTSENFISMGFGGGQAANLERELVECKSRAVDDFKVLAALGVERLGRGDSKKILREFPISEIQSITKEQIQLIEGFGELTATAITNQLPDVIDDLRYLCRVLTSIVPTRLGKIETNSPITGKRIVFTGSMVKGSRPEMIQDAERRGAISQSSVNSKTDYLVAGDNVGASKLSKAGKIGTTVLTEDEYLALIE